MLSKSVARAAEIASRKFPKFDASLLKTPCRKRYVAQPRQYMWALLVANTDMSLQQIGRLTGGYHHTTVLYGSRKFFKELGREYFTNFADEMKGESHGSGS